MKALLCLLILVLSGSAAQQPSAKELYEQAMRALTGSQPDPLRAAALFRRSAEGGYAPAQTALGYWQETDVVLTADPRQAAEGYRRAAAQGDRFGEYAYGRALALGIGVPKDETTAQVWLKKAAAKGDPFAAYYLGYLLEQPDHTTAALWYERAANGAIPQAYMRFGLMLEQGRGVVRDPAEGYSWQLLAYWSGLYAVVDRLKVLAAELGDAKVDELRKLALVRSQALQSKRQASRCTGWRTELNDPPTLPPPQIQRFCR
jgi:TPR repeat protein